MNKSTKGVDGRKEGKEKGMEGERKGRRKEGLVSNNIKYSRKSKI
jgi:hypothetical protein